MANDDEPARTGDGPDSPAWVMDAISRIRGEAAGAVSPDDARELLRLVALPGRRPTAHPAAGMALDFVLAQIQQYLDDPQGGRLEALLGLTRRRGRVASPDTAERAERIACAVLRERLDGRPAMVARDMVAGLFDVGVTVVDDAWSAHRALAVEIELVRARLSGGRVAHTAQQTQLMRDIVSESRDGEPAPG